MRNQILIVLAILFVCGCKDRKPLGDFLRDPTASQIYRYVVMPTGKTLDTGLLFSSGQTVRFSASGNVTSSTGEVFGPDGQPGSPCTGCFQDNNPFLLMGQIGSAVLAIGSGQTFQGLDIPSAKIKILINAGTGASSAISGSYTVDIAID